MRYLLHSLRFYIFLFIVIASTVIYAVYQQVMFVKAQLRDYIHNYEDNEYEAKMEADDKLFKNKRLYIRNIYKIKSRLKNLNTAQTVYNTHLGPIDNRTYVIVIQCRSNMYFLQQLLESLKKAIFINTSLLIFSHDHYSYKINKLIRSINYAKYMQIFYPFSMQLHPNVFPGSEPKSCVQGFPCVMSQHRNPVAAQSKHHWWWQANQIFDHLKVLQNFSDPILFLEEDNYVTEDVLVVFKLLQYARNIHCPFCEMISLAAHHPDISQYTRRKSIVAVEAWTSSMPNTAIAFDRTIWNTIKSWKDLFCYFNDSNWDSSLKHLGSKKWEGNIYLTAIDGPRVFRLEKCDDKHDGCKIKYNVEQVQKFVKLISSRLYPLSIKIKVMANDDFNSTESGYWSDPRDHQLCMHFAK